MDIRVVWFADGSFSDARCGASWVRPAGWKLSRTAEGRGGDKLRRKANELRA